jgi:DNA-directed RNA polymerase subunit RPC12/RpoP
MKCPGQDLQYWKPGAIYEVDCPACGRKVEFFKDDPARRCTHCGHRFVNPRLDFGCAAYCPFAEQCIGNLPPEALAQQENLLKDRVAVEMKKYFKADFVRIGRITRLARHVERIAREEGANPAVALVAAYLSETGSQPGDPSAARQILDRLGAREALTQAVSEVIAALADENARSAPIVSIIKDARRLVDLDAARRDGDSPATAPADLATATGRRLAAEMRGGTD